MVDIDVLKVKLRYCEDTGKLFWASGVKVFIKPLHNVLKRAYKG